MFDRVAPRLWPRLAAPDRTFCQVDGSKLRVSGQAGMHITLGECALEHPMWVADVNDDAILGLDFMREHKCTLLWEPMQASSEEPCMTN